MRYKKKGIEIIADNIEIGNGVQFGKNISISLRGEFSIGDYSCLGDDVHIRGNSVRLGKHLFHSSGLRVGGGGRMHPTADLTVGDRCTLHNNFINICEPVEIGDDVGLSPEVSLLTHGYWLSVLEGYPVSFAGIKIGSGVIIGYRSLVMMGVEITGGCVIGAQSVVTRSINRKAIYAGSPVELIRWITPLTADEKVEKTNNIIESYLPIARYHGIVPCIVLSYPFIHVNKFTINVETLASYGIEDYATDDFRDYIRKWGIRIYTKRPFKSYGF